MRRGEGPGSPIDSPHRRAHLSREPNRVAALGLWTALALVVAAIYLSSFTAVMGVMSAHELPVSAALFADAAARMWDPAVGKLVAAGAAIVAFGVLNGWVLVVANYTRGLVGPFTFAALLSTVTALLAYVGSSAGQILLVRRQPGRFGGKGARRAVVVSAVAFMYSVWAIVGAGWNVVPWGAVLLAAGIPVYLRGGSRRVALARVSAAQGTDAGDPGSAATTAPAAADPTPE